MNSDSILFQYGRPSGRKPATAAVHGPQSLSDAVIRPVSVRSGKCATCMVTNNQKTEKTEPMKVIALTKIGLLAKIDSEIYHLY